MSEDVMDHVHVWTDGSITKNPGGDGGLGIYIESQRLGLGRVLGLYVGEDETNTNNRMEAMAVLAAIRTLKNNPLVVHIYSDSTYTLGGIKNEYSSNVDLWKQLKETYKKRPYYINPIHIKGHDGNDKNEMVDNIANIARKEKRNFDNKGSITELLEKFGK